MRYKSSTGQSLAEYGLILVLVALAAVVVLSVLGPSIGITFHNAADDANNPEVRAIQERQTQIVAGTVTFAVVPTSAYTAAPTSTHATVPPGATLTNTPPSASPTDTLVPTATPEWTYCAVENGTCSFSGTMEVRYGEDGYYNYLILTNGTPCTNAVFGDPIMGVQKHCHYRPASVVPTETPTSTFTPTATSTNTVIAPTATPDWIFCANENGTCSFSGTKEVRYGEAGFYVYLIFTNGTPCTNAVFGDPIVGTGKHCYYRDTSLVPTATPDLNATAQAYANQTATAIANANATATANANATATANANATATALASATNSIETVTAARRSGSNTRKNTVRVNITLAHPGSLVTITDSQSGQVLSNKTCTNSGTPTCTYDIVLLNSQSNGGTITVSGVDFGGQTMTATYGVKP